MPISDKEIVAHCLDGQPDAFRQIVVRYQGPLLAHLIGRTGDREQAEEAAQESFVRAYFSLNKLKKPESFFPWMVGIAERVLRESQRKRISHNKALKQMELVRPEQSDSNDPDPRLARFVAELSDPHREVIQLRYFGGLSCVEVSERLGVPVGTVTKRLSRAYGLLRNSLQQGSASNEREVQR